MIGIIIALVVYQFYKGMIQQDIGRVDIQNELELREVFFGEDLGTTNYVVLCHPEHATYLLSSVFQDASKDMTVPAIFKVIDCDTVMAGSSNKLLYNDFN
jgi:hypothetical protein